MTREDDITNSLSMLCPGSSIIVELSVMSTKKIKFKSIFVGFLPNKFILIQLPNLNNNTEIAAHIKKGVACTIRSLVEGKEGSVIAFMTSIEQLVKLPTKMLVLDIPSKVARQNLRKRTRIDTQLNFETNIADNTIKGTVINISVDGCLLQIPIEQPFNKVEGDTLDFSIPDRSFEEFTSIKSKICNVRKSNAFYELGMKFEISNVEVIKNLLIKILMR